ncbi:SCO2400 family protein [Streptomyces violascens]
MDYCHSCRRHLNGALACAGCGTPAEALAPAPEDELLVYAGRPPSRRAEVFVPSGHRRARTGRRARRKRGKVVLFGSAGLVLVAGAVGFVQMAMEPPPGGDRASAVREDQTISDPQPLPSGSAAGVPSRPTAKPVSSRGHGRGSGTASGKPGRAGEPGPGEPGPVESGPHQSAPARASATPDPGPSGSVPSAPSSPGASDSPVPGGPAPSTPPPPAPKPTKTCTPVLFWCW